MAAGRPCQGKGSLVMEAQDTQDCQPHSTWYIALWTIPSIVTVANVAAVGSLLTGATDARPVIITLCVSRKIHGYIGRRITTMDHAEMPFLSICTKKAMP